MALLLDMLILTDVNATSGRNLKDVRSPSAAILEFVIGLSNG